VEYRILGPLEVASGDLCVRPPGSKPAALLAILLLNANRTVSMDQLIDQLWADDAPRTAANTVQVYISQLRRSLQAVSGQPGQAVPIVRRSPGYLIQIEDDQLDAVKFERLLDQGREAILQGRPSLAARVLGEALALWRGPALADFAYDTFAQGEIQRLEELHLQALEGRITADLALSKHEEVIGELHELVLEHPLRERLRECLMLALYRAGRQPEALDVYRETRQFLGEELGLDPSQQLQDLERAMLMQSPSLHAERHERAVRLPVSSSSFVGREGESRELVELLRDREVRLVTLTGAGGIGKTRLALHVAELVKGAYEHGVVFAPLETLQDSALIPSALGRALDLQHEVGDIAKALTEHLRSRHMLMLLDNFEHLLTGVSQVSDLLLASPGLSVMVTSRALLGLTGEYEFRVPPLSLPSVGDHASLERSEAGALLIARARAAVPGISIATADMDALSEICTRLDGLPLAIELVAPRLRLMSPSILLSRLESGLGSLANGPKDAPARQQTLRQTLDWSYALLDTGDQTVFRRASVFAGSFLLDAAEAVCRHEGEPSVIDAVESLLGQSMLIHDSGPHDEPRFRMLEVIREFGRERLIESDDLRGTSRRHAHYYLELARSSEPALTGPEQESSLKRLRLDLENFRAALRWLQESDPDRGLEMAAVLTGFWVMEGLLSEGRSWLEHFLSNTVEAPEGQRAAALRALGRLAFAQGDFPAAERFFQESLEAYERLRDQTGIRAMLGNVGATAYERGDLRRARDLLDRALRLAREAGDLEAAAFAHNNLGELAKTTGDVAGAIAHFEESLALLRKLGDKDREAAALANLGAAVLEVGDIERALRLLWESLVIFHQLGENVSEVAQCLSAVAQALFELGHAADSARLLGAASGLRDTIGSPIQPTDRQAHDRLLIAVTRALGDASFREEHAKGRTMSIEEAIRLLRRLDPRLHEVGAPGTGPE
jgi:predicted ATPase/DNA-binding SARP family transcriptional activator